jgi:pimeloyl-ACP methyl ester carboxylesterase
MPPFVATHANGQTSYCQIDDFTDPWRPSEAILIQHGFARTSNFWYHWVPALSRRYRVIRRDARGHGQSSYPDPSDTSYAYTVDTIISEIVDTLDQIGVEKVHLLGESTSGFISMIFAARYPERVLSLILCSSPTYLPQAALDLFAFGKKDWPAACRELGSRGWAQALSNTSGTVGAESPEAKEYLRWWIDEVAKSTGEGLAGYAQFLSSTDARPCLKDIKAKTLILAPTKSVAVPMEASRLLEAQIQGSKVAAIDGAGHEIYADKAEDCQKEVLKFLGGL